MRSEEEIIEKIDELQNKLDGIDNGFEEALDDEDFDEFSDQGEELRLEFDQKKEHLEEMIELLEWVLGE